MAAAKKKTGTPGPGAKKAKAAAAGLAVVALERLSDPKVRAQLAEQGRRAAEWAKTWRADRKADGSVNPDKNSPPLLGPLADRLQQRKLERRVKSLKASVAGLASGRPELAELLSAPTATLTEISSGLAVAGGLPRAKQLQAHLEIGRELDQLEATVFEVAMPKT